MSRADALLAKTNSLLNKYGPFNGRTVYKRVITRTGGDDLIGRPGTVTTSDTKLTPQPYFARAGKRNVVVDNTRFQDVITGVGNQTVQVYEMLISVTALSEAEIENKNIVLVFKDSSNNEEIVRIEDYESVAIDNTEIVWQAVAKSIKRA